MTTLINSGDIGKLLGEHGDLPSKFVIGTLGIEPFKREKAAKKYTQRQVQQIMTEVAKRATAAALAAKVQADAEDSEEL